jgi:hypothetical protein
VVANIERAMMAAETTIDPGFLALSITTEFWSMMKRSLGGTDALCSEERSG